MTEVVVQLLNLSHIPELLYVDRIHARPTAPFVDQDASPDQSAVAIGIIRILSSQKATSRDQPNDLRHYPAPPENGGK